LRDSYHVSEEIPDVLRQAPVVPLIQSNDPETAVRIAEALVDGGLRVLEVVLRSEAALDCLAAIGASVDAAIVGAGTVLNAEQAEAAVRAGAGFIVSPGLDEGVVNVAEAHATPVYPGIATAGELQRAWNLGLRLVKFFPASVAGGVPALQAFSGVFRDMEFMPTGGISAANLDEYLGVPAVIACGGSWLTPAEAVAAGDFERISVLAREALEVARRARAG
jgi:2-dehydro-3-deoxyphosphogluconate aldolase/(4S)-4-hydroxy-2-oxoglutarate aldolase